MVLYYSATGNTKFIAKELATLLDDECIDLLDRIKNKDYSELHSDKPFVICAPVYVCEMPRFMSAYLKKQTFSGNKDVYFVFTSGGYCGISAQLAKWMFRKKKMRYMGRAEFKMPRNYVANDSYPMLELDEIKRRITNSYNMIEPTAETIKKGGRLKSRHIWLFETIITVPFNPVWCKYKLKAKDFYCTDDCIACGKCEKLCPLNNITIKNGKPVWGDNCTHCMACIGNCPKDVIEYGTITQSKEQYNFGKYSYIVESLKENK
jgi:ferredoxin